MKVVLLSSCSLRSLAYSVVLNRHTDHEISIVEYGDAHLPEKSFAEPENESWDPLPMWLRRNWRDCYDELCASSERVSVDLELNSEMVARSLSGLQPDLVIYAGAAGNIVGRDLLAIAPVLHMHPGALPAFRGSTTIYWSLLSQQPIVASAIYLSAGIDQGRIVIARNYPVPTSLSDVDGLYDAGIRAWLLDEVLSLGHGLPHSQPQEGEGKDYYVIHPVLKNLVLSRLSPPVRSVQ